MEIKLSPNDIKQIAYQTAVILRDMQKKDAGYQEEWVTTEEAAQILHISPQTMRQRKDEFPHMKNGGNKQGKLRFRKDSLLQSYAQ